MHLLGLEQILKLRQFLIDLVGSGFYGVGGGCDHGKESHFGGLGTQKW